ncbi:MAG: methyltransferase domain-containing protein [Bacteroidia bacterium]
MQKITLVNLIEERVSHPNISSMIGDGTTLSQFHDNSFDVAFSNSVIEHLTTFANQVKMANEMKRLGKYFYVQTPNKYFFIEPHFILPFFQFYPRWLKVFVLTKTKLSRGKKRIRERAEKYIDEIRLLSLSDMKSLFPGAEIYYEKFGFFTKSFVFHNFK